MKKALEILILIIAAPLCSLLAYPLREVTVGNLLVGFAVADILFSFILFWAAARIGGLFATALGALTLLTAYLSGLLTNLPLLISLFLAAAVYALMTTRMKKDDLRIRIAAPLFCKFMVAWLIALKVALPVTSASDALLNSAAYMLGAPHVVTTLIGCGLAAFFYGKAEHIPWKGNREEYKEK